MSCLLRGADKIFDHCKKKLGIGNKEDTPDGLFHLEEVECIGACSWAPAMQVNYDYPREPDAGEDGRVIDGIKKKEQQ